MSDNTISGTLSTLQSVYGRLKDIADLNEVHAIKAQIGELQSQILSAQESALRSQEREALLSKQISELKQHIAQIETWDNEKQRYQLTDFGGGTFAYLLKPGMENGEPEHRLCPACFQKSNKSILQFKRHTSDSQDIYECPACKTEYRFGAPREHYMPASYDEGGPGFEAY